MNYRHGRFAIVGIAAILVSLSSVFVLRARSTQTPATISEKATTEISRALGRFIYVGYGACKTSDSPPHGSTPRSLPLPLLADHCYVFHIPNAVPEGLSTFLEHELASNNIRVTRTPRSPDDYVYLMTGGPLFQIHFEQGRSRGTITIVQHRKGADGYENMTPSCRLEDLVLRYSR